MMIPLTHVFFKGRGGGGKCHHARHPIEKHLPWKNYVYPTGCSGVVYIGKAWSAPDCHSECN